MQPIFEKVNQREYQQIEVEFQNDSADQSPIKPRDDDLDSSAISIPDDFSFKN